MLYIEYNFHRWLADVGPTLARRSKSRWPNVGSQRRTDGCADVGPTSVRRWNAIWVVLNVKKQSELCQMPLWTSYPNICPEEGVLPKYEKLTEPQMNTTKSTLALVVGRDSSMEKCDPGIRKLL